MVHSATRLGQGSQIDKITHLRRGHMDDHISC